METKYINNKTYIQFKNWVKALCMYGKCLDKNTAHAIFSAYYIFRHHLNNQEITEFLDKDFSSSLKVCTHHNMLIDRCLPDISKKKACVDFQFDGRYQINSLKPYYLSLDSYNEDCHRIWHNNVLSIYYFWREKELCEL